MDKFLFFLLKVISYVQARLNNRLMHKKYRNKKDIIAFVDNYIEEDNKVKLSMNNMTIYLRDDSSDMLVFAQVFLRSEYGNTINLYEHFFEKQHLNIVDAGANIGLTSIFFSQKFNGKSLNIACVEIDPENFKLLKQNTNEITKSNSNHLVSLFQNAIWSTDNELISISNEFRDGGHWSKSAKHDTNGDISTITLGTLMNSMEWQEIDILKIDIEGAEKELFYESQNELKKTLSKVNCIVIEPHYEVLNIFDFNAQLAHLGFSVFNIDKHDLIYALNNKFIH